MVTEERLNDFLADSTVQAYFQTLDVVTWFRSQYSINSSGGQSHPQRPQTVKSGMECLQTTAQTGFKGIKYTGMTKTAPGVSIEIDINTMLAHAANRWELEVRQYSSSDQYMLF